MHSGKVTTPGIALLRSPCRGVGTRHAFRVGLAGLMLLFCTPGSQTMVKLGLMDQAEADQKRALLNDPGPHHGFYGGTDDLVPALLFGLPVAIAHGK